MKILGRLRTRARIGTPPATPCPWWQALWLNQPPLTRHIEEKNQTGITERAKRHRERPPPPASEKGRARSGLPKGQSLEERPLTGSLQIPGFSYEDQYFGRCDSGHFLACSIGGRSAVALRSCCTAGNASIRSRQAYTTGNLGYIVWPSRLRPNE